MIKQLVLILEVLLVKIKCYVVGHYWMYDKEIKHKGSPSRTRFCTRCKIEQVYMGDNKVAIGRTAYDERDWLIIKHKDGKKG